MSEDYEYDTLRNSGGGTPLHSGKDRKVSFHLPSPLSG